MACKRLPMRKLRWILKLKYEDGMAHRAIARACSVGVATVSLYLDRAKRAGINWPLPHDLDDAALEAQLFPKPSPEEGSRPRPDLVKIHEELKRKGVTLLLLWQEYREDHPEGYGYSQFCEIYHRWRKKLNPSMRQRHRAGEKTFIDYSGTKPHYIDSRTGEEIPAELFVAVLGASSLTYAEATESQRLPAWVKAHIQMAEYFGGSTEIWVPDNLKSGINTPCRYEPEVNRTYQDLAEHYGAVVIPARAGKPKDKAKVEVGVLLAQRWILAVLRDQTFFSLAELNQGIKEALEKLNDRPMQKLGMSRREQFERLDLPVLKPLPVNRYELAEWRICRANIDYHIELDHNFYSVSHQLVHRKVEVRFTQSTVEVFLKNRRVTSHRRLYGRGKFSTQPEHMPRSHRAHAEWTPSRLIRWAENSGPATGRFVDELLRRRPHPEQGYRSCLGLMRLGKKHGRHRLDAACARAESLSSYSYKTVKNILSSGMDRLPLENEPSSIPPISTHENIRGADYYAKQESKC